MLKGIKKAQEEMIGFALIVILVSVILLIFFGFSLTNKGKSNVESYEVESFIQSFLQYTSTCKDNLEPLSVQNLIIYCNNQRNCVNGENSCKVLNNTLEGIVKESWPFGENRPIKGYVLNINSGNKDILDIQKGNVTSNSQGALQTIANSPYDIKVTFTAYS